MTPALRRLSAQLTRALRDHLAGAPARPPEAGVQLWQAFAALSAGRRGIEPLAAADMLAWAQLARVPLAPQHVELIRALDATWLDHARAELAKGAPGRPAGELTPAAFDAVF